MDGPRVSSRVNCAEPDHISPLTFLQDVLTRRVLDFVLWANRAGSKSYLGGLISWALSSSLPGLETTILGGSFAQSAKVYKAMDGFFDLSGTRRDLLAAEPTRQLTLWLSGSSVAVLTASTKSTRGPHPQVLLMDEIDEMAPDVYSAALSQTQSKDGRRAALGKMSTNHRHNGVMDSAVTAARTDGTALYKWCIWDCLRPCLDYSCSTCSLSRFCPGPQMKTADGYYEIEDFIQKLTKLSLAVLEVEWFCRKAGRPDLVYGDEYDEALHAPPDAPDFNPSYPVFVSIDWGGTNPFSCGAWQRFSFAWVRIDEVYQGNTTNTRFIGECKKRPWWMNVLSGVADPSRADLIGEWNAERTTLAPGGIPLEPADNAVESGIEAVKNALRPVIGPPAFIVNPRRCHSWMSEIMNYQNRKGKPVKDFDHALDETRYFIKWQIAGRPARKGRVFQTWAKPAAQGTPEAAIQDARAAPPVPPGTGSLRKGRVFVPGTLKPKEPAPASTPEPESAKPAAAPQPPPPGDAVQGGFNVRRKGKVFG